MIHLLTLCLQPTMTPSFDRGALDHNNWYGDDHRANPATGSYVLSDPALGHSSMGHFAAPTHAAPKRGWTESQAGYDSHRGPSGFETSPRAQRPRMSDHPISSPQHRPRSPYSNQSVGRSDGQSYVMMPQTPNRMMMMQVCRYTEIGQRLS